ncbi:MAG: acyltransferase family protein [Saccharofermentans sp.]|nr:acyltransferase family protein [Saccharofermentans sp.]
MSSITVASRKSNKKFMVLSAFAIIMIVDSHAQYGVGLFNSVIPFNSFFIPLFVFISGYFNKVDGKTDLLGYIRKKEQSLLVPYFGFSVVGVILSLILYRIKNGTFQQVNYETFLRCFMDAFTLGAPVTIVFSIWFVIVLFVMLVVYASLRKLFGKRWNSIAAFIIFMVFSTAVVWCVKTFDVPQLVLLPLKTIFLMPYLELGIIYRDKLEDRLSKLKPGGNILLLGVLLLINMIRMMYLPEPLNVEIGSIDSLSGFDSPFIITPVISSVIGILFWVTIAELFGSVLYENKVINYISENTFWIMALHFFFFNLLNCILMFIDSHIIPLKEFDKPFMCETEWYRWEPIMQFRILYLLIGLAGPLGLKLLYDKIKSSVMTSKAGSKTVKKA